MRGVNILPLPRFFKIPGFKDSVLFLLVFTQVLNNPYLAFSEVMNPGKLFVAFFAYFCCLYLITVRRKITIFDHSVLIATLLLFYYGSVLIGTVTGVDPKKSIHFGFTASMQCLIFFLTILTVGRENLKWVFRGYMYLAVFLCALNAANAFVPGFSFLEVRDSTTRLFFDIDFQRFSERRVISVTGTYGQFAYFAIFGGFLYIDQTFGRVNGPSSVLKAPVQVLILIVVICGIISTQSRSAYVNFAFAAVWYFLLSPNRIIKSVTAISLGVLLFMVGPTIVEGIITVREVTVYNRLESDVMGLSLLLERPLGIGQGGFQAETGMEKVLHNTFIDCYIISGWIGGTAFLGFMLSPILLLWRHRRSRHLPIRGMLAGYIGGLGVLNFYNGLTEYHFFFFPAISIIVAQALKGECCNCALNQESNGGSSGRKTVRNRRDAWSPSD